MHFSNEHEELISSCGNGNRIVPREKLTPIDMLIIQFSSSATDLLNSSI